MSYLFLSGEVTVTLPMCVQRVDWQHTTVARTMRVEAGRVSYGALAKRFNAILWYCSVDDEETRLNNQHVIRESKIPCWPRIELLEMWGDRRCKLHAAVNEGLVGDVTIARFESFSSTVADRDLVVKVGNLHVGEGKILVRAGELFPVWDDLASIEPFVEGRSVRVYVVGEQTFGVEYVNELTWIKNAPGTETFEIHLDDALIDHAKCVHRLYGFPISGVDYIVRPDGSFRFLEHNHFPGITLHAGAEKAIKSVFVEAMNALELAARK